MRLHLQATALTIALFAVSTTMALPTFSATRSALTSLLANNKRSPQGPWDMAPLDDDEMEAAAQAWGIEDLDISDTPFSDAMPQAAGAA